MKIIFNHLTGRIVTLENVSKDTTLREVKKYYESEINLKRSDYKFIINRKEGVMNDNSLLTFPEYLKTTHGLDFDENSILNVHVRLFCHGNFFKVNDILPGIEEHEESNLLTCGISLELINGAPVKINNKFYDFDNFLRYCKGEKEKYDRAINSGMTYIPRCPLRQPLPEYLQNAIKTVQSANDLYGFLKRVSAESLEEYEDNYKKLSGSIPLNSLCQPK